MTALGFAWFAQTLSAANSEVLFTIGIALDSLFPAIAGHLLLVVPERPPPGSRRALDRGRRLSRGDGPADPVAAVRGRGARRPAQLPRRAPRPAAVGSPRRAAVPRRGGVRGRQLRDRDPPLARGVAAAAPGARAGAVDRRRGPARVPGREGLRRRRLAAARARAVRRGAAGDRPVRLPGRPAAQPARPGGGDVGADRAARRRTRARGAARRARRRARRSVARARLLAAGVRPLRRRRRPPGRAARRPLDRGLRGGRADRRDRARRLAGRRAAARAGGGGGGRAGAREPAPVGRAARPDRGAARVARADRRGRRHRAAAARARPARRRAGAPGRAGHEAAARAPQGRRRRRRAARRVLGRPPGEPRRAARAGARHPPGGADGPRPGSGSAQPGRPRAAAGRDRGRPAGGPAPGRRHRALLRRRRGAHERRQVRKRERGDRAGAPRGGLVVAEISDDGVGGARLDAGSGLRGLTDRVAALDGRLALDSPPGAGTRLRVEIP